MLDISQTRYFQYTEKTISNADIEKNIVEGSPLVLKMEEGLGKVGLPTGAATEQFVGVAFAGFVRPENLVAVEKINVPADGAVIALKHLPLGGVAKIGATVNGVHATVDDQAAVANKPKYTAAANTLTFAADDANKEYVIVYSYAATVAEARAVAGDGYPGGFVLSELSGTVGVIHQGQVATDQFDMAADWTTADTAPVKLNADGKFTMDGNGATVANARVLSIPGVQSEYLVLQLL